MSKSKPKKKIGLGDLIAKVTRELKLKECDGCKKRKKALNRFKINW